MARRMKDSGVAWIGQVPAGWSVERIASLYNVRNEKCSDKEYSALSVTMQGIVPQLEDVAKTDDGDNRKLVRIGDFVINSRSDRRGACGISQYDGSVSLINTVLRPFGDMNNGYYSWLFRSFAFADEFYANGHGIVDDLWTTRWQDMKRIKVPFPPLAEQRKIAEFLDRECGKLDALVDKVKAQIAQLEACKKSIITEAFSTGAKKIKLKYCAYLRARLGWKGLKAEEYVDEGYQFFSAHNIVNGELVFEPAVYIDKFRYDESPEIKLKVGDSLLVKDGAGVGKTAMVRKLKVESAPNGSLAVITPSKRFDPLYFNYYFKSSFFANAIMPILNGMGVPHLFQSDLRELSIPCPPLAEQRKIAEYLDEKCGKIDGLIKKSKEQLEKLAEYKKSLIYEYVTGKKEVAA